MLSNWTQNDIVADHVSIHYTRTGDGSQPPLVLAHGFSDNGMCWLPVARDLAADYDVILPDARGHGLSQRVQPGDKVDMAADLAGLVRGLGLEPVILGGHSMGASTAALTEARFPGLTRALILEDPAWFIPKPSEPGKPEQPRQNPFDKWLQTMAGKTVEELMAKCHQDNPTWPEVELRPWAESKMQFDMNTFSTAREPGMDWQEAVKLITCPTLLITAENDKGSIVTPQAAQLAVELNNKVQVVHISGAGHSIRRENYADYMKAIQTFLHDL